MIQERTFHSKENVHRIPPSIRNAGKKMVELFTFGSDKLLRKLFTDNAIEIATRSMELIVSQFFQFGNLSIN